MNQRYNNGSRCAICGRTYTARLMQNGMMSQTCGNTACVSALTSRQNRDSAPRQYIPTAR